MTMSQCDFICCLDADVLEECLSGMFKGGPDGHKIQDDFYFDHLSGKSAYQANLIPAGTLQLTSQGEGIHTLTMTNSTTAGGTIVQYSSGQDGEFYVPGEIVVTQNTSIGGGPLIPEDQARKREMRLLKNREAARECRRKKKEYIKCLENRVAVLENQNKALIEELKSLKELYCQQKQE